MGRKVTGVTVHPSLILWLSALFYLRPGLALPFLGAMGFHELGHLLALLWMKKPPLHLTLSFVGAKMETPPLGYRQTMLAAAGGPAFSLLLGLSLPAAPALGLCSLALGLFNLLPLAGLDGGKILESFLLLRLREDRARRLTAAVSLTGAGGLCLLAARTAARLDLGLWPLALAAAVLGKALESGRS